MKVYFFKAKHLVLALILTFAILLGIIIISNFNPAAQEMFYTGMISPALIIDPGHGGLDGGAVSDSGLIEAPVNLAVSQRTRDIFGFLGISSIMTREDEASLEYSDENSIRQNKTADLKARLKISQNNPDCDFLSIHLNKYEQQKYSGAQVFFSPNNNLSAVLASAIQEKMRIILDPSNTRRAKLSPNSVFLMEQITAPAVTIECGFLSNINEATLLSTPEYQTKIAISICCGYIDYIETSDI